MLSLIILIFSNPDRHQYPMLLDRQVLAAIKDNDIESIKLLLTLKNTNLTDFSKMILLHWAITSGQEETVRLLLDQGASLEMVSSDQNTLLMIRRHKTSLDPLIC